MICSEVVLTNISEKWLDIIYKGETKEMLDTIVSELSKLEDIHNITPKQQDWFAWCRYTPLDDIKIIILGQDPYHKKEWAHGLSFSCMKKIPPSLRNIYKCLINSKLISKKPVSGDLSSWATQGVLLLNTSLSTTIGKAGAHLKLWNPYINKVIERITQYHYDICNQLIFMLWGEFAKKFASNIDEDFHILMSWKHPSPLAQRGSVKEKFIYCNHFFKANEFLREEKREINWDSINVSLVTNKYDDAKTTLNICKTHTIAFTDGSCYPNNSSKESVGGYSALFTSGELSDTYIYGSLDTTHKNATNIRAEGFAILRVMEIIDDKKNKHPLTIITDCEFWIKMIEIYMPKWSDAKFEEKNNTDLTTKIWKTYKNLSKKITIKLIHVKSHNKNGWREYDEGTYERYCYDQNDYVDKLCTLARENLERGSEEINPVVYE